jgi:hypothetical protein
VADHITSRAPDRSPVSRTEVVLWWAATLIVLAVLDDLTFGPVFWTLSRLVGPVVAVVAVYAVYVPVQVFLVRRATTDDPGRLARFLLARFDVQRRFQRVADNETRLRSCVVGGGSALLMSLVIGGVLAPLLLWRSGWPRRTVRRLSIATAVLYATEFAVLHGLLPSAI